MKKPNQPKFAYKHNVKCYVWDKITNKLVDHAKSWFFKLKPICFKKLHFYSKMFGQNLTLFHIGFRTVVSLRKFASVKIDLYV